MDWCWNYFCWTSTVLLLSILWVLRIDWDPLLGPAVLVCCKCLARIHFCVYSLKGQFFTRHLRSCDLSQSTGWALSQEDWLHPFSCLSPHFMYLLQHFGWSLGQMPLSFPEIPCIHSPLRHALHTSSCWLLTAAPLRYGRAQLTETGWGEGELHLLLIFCSECPCISPLNDDNKNYDDDFTYDKEIFVFQNRCPPHTTVFLIFLNWLSSSLV